MKHLIKTDDYSSLEYVKYDRVVFDSTDNKVYCNHYVNPIDIVLYDKNAARLIVVKNGNWTAEKYPSEGYTPVGVVVVPASHNVYGDGSCGVMSLVNMNLNTPDTGSTSIYTMYWGGYGVDVDTLPNLDQAPYVGRCDAPGDETSTVVGKNSGTVCIPSDQFESMNNPCPHDLNSYYYDNSSSRYAAPSPYLTNGSRNPAYYQTTAPSSTENCLADFNGKQNTQILCDLATAQADWKTAATITNSHEEGYYPAACCCWRFHTEGTKQGDWYLPACGELGYVMARFKSINDTISLLRNAYGSSIGSSVSSDDYWSSSEYSYNFVRNVGFNDGYVSNYYKYRIFYCRSFCRL